LDYEPKGQALLITAKIIAITAITNKMWIKLPAEAKKNPKTHPIIRITAIMYSKLLILICFS
jgi:hypothetical protein